MASSSIIGTLILLLTALVSYKGFTDERYKEQYIFDVDKILIGKEYKRLFTSGFLHANWIHLGFNMIALMGFSLSLESELGLGMFTLIYFASLTGGSLFSLFIHRNHGDYRALGASGAVSGVVLASIILFPEGKIGFIILPFELDSWIFALLFIVISIFGIKSQSDNIGHEAHLGGGIIGVLLTMAIKPSLIVENGWIILLILIPTVIFLVLIIKKPEILLTNKWGFEKPQIRRKPVAESPEVTMNKLLDKIKRSGVNSLTKKEKQELERLKDKL